MDSNLRLSPHSKLLVNYQTGKGRRPLVVTKEAPTLPDDRGKSERRHRLATAGAEIVTVPELNRAHTSFFIPDAQSYSRETVNPVSVRETEGDGC